MSSERTVLAVSKITRHFQVTVVKEVRVRFDFKEGDTVIFVEEGGKLLLEKE